MGNQFFCLCLYYDTHIILINFLLFSYFSRTKIVLLKQRLAVAVIDILLLIYKMLLECHLKTDYCMLVSGSEMLCYIIVSVLFHCSDHYLEGVISLISILNIINKYLWSAYSVSSMVKKLLSNVINYNDRLSNV